MQNLAQMLMLVLFGIAACVSKENPPPDAAIDASFPVDARPIPPDAPPPDAPPPPPPVIIKFTALPNLVSMPGQPVTLEWATNFTVICRGNWIPAGQNQEVARSGKIVVPIYVDTDYTLTCNGGENGATVVSASASVYVLHPMVKE